MAVNAEKTFRYQYPRPSITVDVAIVTRETQPRILLIRRKSPPFEGKWALPGGFVEENEPLVDAARRELKEETDVEALNLEQVHTFGDPGRDPRGWTVSVVYLARVAASDVSPKAGDDAAAVGWFSLEQPPLLAFDHANILSFVQLHLADRPDEFDVPY